MLVIQRDWKAKTGEDAHGSWSGTVEKFALGTANDRGQRLLQFAKTHQLVAANSLFKHKLSRRATWHSPDGKSHNQFDYILISRRFAPGVNKARTRTMTKPDIGSDHDMASMTFIGRLSVRKKKVGRTFFDLEKLKDATMAEMFQADLAGRFAPLMLLQSGPQELCDVFTKVMEEVAEDNLGRAKRPTKKWITTEVLACCDDGGEKKRKRKLGTTELEQYREANRKTRNGTSGLLNRRKKSRTA